MSPLRAYSADKQVRLAFDLTKEDRGKAYYCPICAERFRLVMPVKTNRVKHFRHINGHYHGEPESIEHLQLKEYVYNTALKLGYSANLEYVIDAGKEYIADVLVSNGKAKIAIECQCSPTGTDYVRDKTVFYWNSDYTPLWIFGIRWFDKAFFSNKHSRGYFIQRISSIEKWLWHRECPIFYSNGEEEFYRFNDFKFRMASHSQQMNGQQLSTYLGWFSISKITLQEILARTFKIVGVFSGE